MSQPYDSRMAIVSDMIESIALLKILEIRKAGEVPSVESLHWLQEMIGTSPETLMGALSQQDRRDRGKLLGALGHAVAVMAFCPGGITLFGRHYEAQLPKTVEDAK